MALRKSWTIHAAGRAIEVENAYHRVQDVNGNKRRLLVVVAVQDGPGKPPLTTWSFGFEPTPGAGDWDAQAYEALKRHPRMLGAVDDISGTALPPRRAETFEERKARIEQERAERTASASQAAPEAEEPATRWESPSPAPVIDDVLKPEPITWDEDEAEAETQADEVKPTEGDIHEAEYDLHEPTPGYVLGDSGLHPLSIDDLVRSGTMLTEDEFAMRVGVLSGKIEQYAQQRIASRYDANARADIMRDFQTYIHKGALGLTITPAEDAAYQRANERNAWITAQETHARLLRESLPTLSLEMLRAYSLEKAGWPE